MHATLTQDLKLALATNTTDTSFTSKIPTTTEPSGAGVHKGGAETLVAKIFGAGADNSTSAMRLIGWNKAGKSTLAMWIPEVIGEVSCVYSAAVGIAGQKPAETDRFSDANTVVTGLPICSTVAADTPATAVFDISGFAYYETLFNVGTATNSNALLMEL